MVMCLILVEALLILQALLCFATAGPSLGIDPQTDVSDTLSKLKIVEKPPSWAQQRSEDYLLDFSKADVAVTQQQQGQPVRFRDKPLNITHQQGYYHGNIAIVRFGSQFYVAVRKIQFYFTLRTLLPEYPLDDDPGKKWISWWVSRVSLCTADAATLQPVACSDFDPRSWRDTECMWNGGFESLGPEDPRLIIWPGKGLFIMFISKPWAVDPTGKTPSATHCSGPLAQQPWLMPLVAYQGANSHGSSISSGNSAGSADPWLRPELIRLQYLPAAAAVAAHSGSSSSSSSKHHSHTRSKHHVLLKEKNWNPFIYKNQLYFSQSFHPHVVVKPYPNGTCVKVYQTESRAFSALPARPRGNTQAVLLPAAITGEAEDVYLGIVHVEVARSYVNHFYKMQAQPPFQITAVSAPIPLIAGAHPRVPAWKHISFPMSLQLLEETQQLMIGYGSGDQASRVSIMGLEAVLQHFKSG